jgi:hypothetical protein
VIKGEICGRAVEPSGDASELIGLFAIKGPEVSTNSEQRVTSFGSNAKMR